MNIGQAVPLALLLCILSHNCIAVPIVRDGEPSSVVDVNVETVYLAAGCYWSIELAFQRLPGVMETSVGFAGGMTTSPTYEAVTTGSTGHAETVEVKFNQKKVSFDEILKVFFALHDPTTKNRQGGDVGTQYRSAIFFTSAEQQAAAKMYMEQHQKKLSRPIVTELSSISGYTRAVVNHQKYLQKLGQNADKGAVSPIRCYGNRGPWKQIKESVQSLFTRKNDGGVSHDEF